MNRPFYQRIGAFNNLSGLFFSIGYYFPPLCPEFIGILFITRYCVVKLFLLEPNLLPLVFPVSFITGDIQQIFVEIHIIASYYCLGIAYYFLRQSYFSRYFQSARTSGITD